MLEGVQSLDAETGNALLDDAEILCRSACATSWCFPATVVREVPPYLRGKNLVHRVSFLNRAEGVSVAEFRREWCYAHAKLVEAVPGHAGYNQNLVIDRFVDGASVSSEKLPCDGMAEFYFEDMDAFECFYDSKEFQRLAAHGSEFIGSVDTYLVDTIRCGRVGARRVLPIGEFCETDRRPASSEAGCQFLKRSEGFVSSRYSFDCPRSELSPNGKL